METHKYDDIISLPRPISPKHARMSMIDRAAQFAPFAALVGYDAVLRETARLTESETELDEGGKELLDRKLRYLADHPEEAAPVTFTVFRPDEFKPGGSYERVTGAVKKIDTFQKAILLADGSEIWIEDIRSIEGVD